MSGNASQFVGSIPENYDNGLGPHIFEPFGKDIAQRAARAGPEKVLELAAGTGIVSRQLKDAIQKDASLTVTDLNDPMLEIAKSKFGQEEKVSFEAVDACALPYPANHFDLIACQFGVMFFPDKARHYSEALRVLKPRGAYIFNSWGPWAENQFANIAHDIVASHFPDNPPVFYEVPFSYHDAAAIENALEEAGFTAISVEEVRFSQPIASVADFARGLIFGNPVSAEITERGGDCDKIRDELQAALSQSLNGRLELMALVATGKKAG